jgi:hypothetical protein
MLLENGKKVGPYEILAPLGEGGMDGKFAQLTANHPQLNL